MAANKSAQAYIDTLREKATAESAQQYIDELADIESEIAECEEEIDELHERLTSEGMRASMIMRSPEVKAVEKRMEELQTQKEEKSPEQTNVISTMMEMFFRDITEGMELPNTQYTLKHSGSFLASETQKIRNAAPMRLMVNGENYIEANNAMLLVSELWENNKDVLGENRSDWAESTTENVLNNGTVRTRYVQKLTGTNTKTIDAVKAMMEARGWETAELVRGEEVKFEIAKDDNGEFVVTEG